MTRAVAVFLLCLAAGIMGFCVKGGAVANDANGDKLKASQQHADSLASRVNLLEIRTAALRQDSIVHAKQIAESRHREDSLKAVAAGAVRAADSAAAEFRAQLTEEQQDAFDNIVGHYRLAHVNDSLALVEAHVQHAADSVDLKAARATIAEQKKTLNGYNAELKKANDGWAEARKINVPLKVAEAVLVGYGVYKIGQSLLSK